MAWRLACSSQKPQIEPRPCLDLVEPQRRIDRRSGEDVGGLVDAGAELVVYGSLFSDGFELQSEAFWTSVSH